MDSDLVMQLHFLRIELLGQSSEVGGLGQIIGQRLGHALRQGHPLKHQGQFLQCGMKTQRPLSHRIGDGEQLRAVLGEQGVTHPY